MFLARLWKSGVILLILLVLQSFLLQTSTAISKDHRERKRDNKLLFEPEIYEHNVLHSLETDDEVVEKDYSKDEAALNEKVSDHQRDNEYKDGRNKLSGLKSDLLAMVVEDVDLSSEVLVSENDIKEKPWGLKVDVFEADEEVEEEKQEEYSKLGGSDIFGEQKEYEKERWREESGAFSSEVVEEVIQDDKEETLRAMMERMRYPGKFDGTITCDLCVFLVEELQWFVKEAQPTELIVAVATEVCKAYKIEDDRVCTMIVQEMKDVVIYVFSHGNLVPREVCGRFLGSPCPHYEGPWWNVTFPSTPKPELEPEASRPRSEDPTSILRVLQITDIHMDFQYLEGTIVECGEPVCCREFTKPHSGQIHSPFTTHLPVENKAGKFGSYGSCDLCNDTTLSLFQHLNTIRDQIDLIYFTGDVPAHDIWNQTHQTQLSHINYLDKLFATYLPGIPVYYAMGNHEICPCDNFPLPGIPEFPTDWLLGPLSDHVWGQWLDEAAKETILKCGSYSYSPFQGFRIISLNNIYCEWPNFFLMLNATDPCGSLQWMIGELQKAEDKGEKVHVLTHIPNSSCLKAWSWNFYKIINRYEKTITNIFYGHTHHDSYQMYYDEETFQRPLGVGFVGGSVSPAGDINPSYRIYIVDGNYTGSSWSVLDYNHFYANLTKANHDGRPEWKIAYNPRRTFNMKGLTAVDFEDLLQRMEKNETLFQTFYKLHNTLGPSGPCDESCKENLLCSIKQGRSDDDNLCKIHK